MAISEPWPALLLKEKGKTRAAQMSDWGKMALGRLQLSKEPQVIKKKAWSCFPEQCPFLPGDVYTASCHVPYLPSALQLGTSFHTDRK